MTFLRGLVLMFLAGTSLAPTWAGEACDFKEDPAMTETNYRKLVNAYNKRTGAPQISVARLKKWMAKGKKLVLLDVRPLKENQVSTLAGAKHVYPTKKKGWPELDLPKDAEIVAFCSVGYRAGWASRAYEEKLGRKVWVLDGGLIAWYNAGGELVDAQGKPTEEIDPFTPEFARFIKPR